MKVLLSFVFLSFFVGNGFAMESLELPDTSHGFPHSHNEFAELDSEWGSGSSISTDSASSLDPFRLHMAVAMGKIDEVAVLLDDSSINVNEQDDRGNTALHVAFELEKVDCINLIVKQCLPRLDLAIRNNKKQTIFDCASKCFPLSSLSINGKPLKARVFGYDAFPPNLFLMWACQFKTSVADDVTTYLFSYKENAEPLWINVKKVGWQDTLVFNHEGQDFCLMLEAKLFLDEIPVEGIESFVDVQPLKLVEAINWLKAEMIS